MVKLFCALVGVKGNAFSVTIDASESVDDLKDAIAEKQKYDFAASTLHLFLARNGDTTWLESSTDDVKKLKKGEKTALIEALTHEDKELQGESGLQKVLEGMPEPSTDQIHVLVVVPEVSATKKIKWSAEELSTVDPQVQLNLWKSVVRITVSISSEVVCSATALVVDRTLSQLYLLTNLHLWSDELFADDLSNEFKQEITRYSNSHRAKKASGKRKQEFVDVSEPPLRKSPRTSRKKASTQPEKPQVVIEQLLPDGKKLAEVHKFSLASDICWRSSADFDFAIFEVAVPQDIQLVRCEMSTEVYPTMHVHLFGFPGILKDAQFGHPYAIIPAEITGWHWNQMTLSTLSAPGLSGSAVVCTKRGISVGYIGGGFDGSAKNEQYQSYGFTLHGIPQDLPSVLSA